MSKLTYSYRLFREYYRFARVRKIYWILPLAMFVVLMGFFIFVGETVAPVLYTLF